MSIENPQGIAPDPSEEDKEQIAKIVRDGLGKQVEGSFIGAMAKGQHGDAAFYGHAVVIDDPEITNYKDDFDAYYARVGVVARSIGNSSLVAGNVVLDITRLKIDTISSK
jgi:hypothetical protein